MILKWLTPSWCVSAIQEVNLERLSTQGVRGVIFDLDNTLVAADAAEPLPPVRAWIARLHAMGFRSCIVSNNFAARTKAIGQILQVSVVTGAVKPAPWAFRRAMRLMGTRPSQTALIGDQVFTDVLGGNLLGIRTILVDPISSREFPTTRLVRLVERLVRGRIVRRAGGL